MPRHMWMDAFKGFQEELGNLFKLETGPSEVKSDAAEVPL